MPNNSWRTGKLELVLSCDGQRETIHVLIADLPFRGQLKSGGDSAAVSFHLELAYTAYRPGQRVRIYLHPSNASDAERFELVEARFVIPLEVKTSVFCNGYQSWTETRLFKPDEKIPAPNPLGKWLVEPYGDYRFLGNKRLKGPHAWSYTYRLAESPYTLLSELEKLPKNTVKIPEQFAEHAIHFVGSMDEANAFTRFDWSPSTLEILRDLPSGVAVPGIVIPEKGQTVFDLFLMGGVPKDIFPRYFDKQRIPRPTAKAATGWTSWYSEYTNISEDLLRDRLQSLKEATPEMTFFQIDDGWQARVGDWLQFSQNFPRGAEGMLALASEVKQAGFKPGLWLAPFVCEKKSELFKKHPDWLLKDEKGKPVRAGYTPLWSGTFYALDSENPDVRNYLKKVFKQVFAWGFELVKLDFLYAAALAHKPGKPRAQLMRSAMEFLRDCVGDKLILACGVPLASAFGLVDYCRIGADVHTSWEHTLLKKMRNRERVSTRLSIENTIARRHLNGLGFLNDPDVFQLRNYNTKLTNEEQKLLLHVNQLLGGLLFHSDNPAKLDSNALSLLKSVGEQFTDQSIQCLAIANGVYSISCTRAIGDQKAKSMILNLTDNEIRLGSGKQPAALPTVLPKHSCSFF